MRPDSLAYRLIQYPGIGALRFFDFLTSAVTNDNPIRDTNSIEFCSALEANWKIFRQEYDMLLSVKELKNVRDFYKVQTDLKQDDNWKAFPLVLFNYRFKENSQLCLNTYEFISGIPGCTSAMFSTLGPWKHVPAHRGIYKGLLRCLLGLSVPVGDECWIKINGKKIPFEEGKCIVFDETAEHEVFNGNNRPRVVLYLDIYRRLPFPVNKLNDLIFHALRRSPFVTNILSEYCKFDPMTFEESTPKVPVVR